MIRSRLPAAALVLLALAAPAPMSTAWADEGLTTRSAVVPMVDNGRLVGCQAPFEVLRGDPEYSGGRRVRVGGRLSVISPEGRAGVMLQLFAHGPDEGDGGEGTAPLSLVLRDGAADNAAERHHPQDPREDDPALFLFNLGPVTSQALRGAAQDGRFTLAYALKDSGPMALLTVDLTVRNRTTGERAPGAPQSFADCLRRLRLDELTR